MLMFSSASTRGDSPFLADSGLADDCDEVEP